MGPSCGSETRVVQKVGRGSLGLNWPFAGLRWPRRADRPVAQLVVPNQHLPMPCGSESRPRQFGTELASCRVWSGNSAEAVLSRIGQLRGSGGQRPTQPSRRAGRPVAQLVGPNQRSRCPWPSGRTAVAGQQPAESLVGDHLAIADPRVLPHDPRCAGCQEPAMALFYTSSSSTSGSAQMSSTTEWSSTWNHFLNAANDRSLGQSASMVCQP